MQRLSSIPRPGWETIVEGQGKLNIEGTRWDLLGPDLPKGAAVRVTAVEGMRLRVSAA